MRKHAYFNNIRLADWPTLKELAPFFLSYPPGSGWFHESGNDSGGLSLEGIEGSEHLPFGRGRIDIRLSMWGNPEHGVLLIYSKRGGPYREDYTSKGDLSKLKVLVRSLHDTPLPVGLFIPFAKAWLAVKEFIESEGQLPKSIEWVKNSDLPPNTFPDP